MQASDWLGLINAGEVEDFESLPYLQQIARLEEIASARNKTLVIRDWTTVNYLHGVSGTALTPSRILEQSVYLAYAGYSLQTLVVTRRARSVYKSICQSFSHLSGLPLAQFSVDYLAYANAVRSLPRVSLEALQSSPRETLTHILQEFGLSTNHVELQLNRFADFHRCTGNNTLTHASVSSSLRHIAPLDCEGTLDTCIETLPLLTEADRLLGYIV
jgi:hypothetical protein